MRIEAQRSKKTTFPGQLRYAVFLLLTEHANGEYLSAAEIHARFLDTDFSCTQNTIRAALADMVVFVRSDKYDLQIIKGKKGKNVRTDLYRLVERKRR